MIRNASLKSGRAAILYDGCKSTKVKLSPYIFSIIFLVVFTGFTVPVDARQHATIAAGGNHSLGVKTDGTVAAWGYNVYRQSTVPAGLAGVKEVSAGVFHSLALKSDGTVVAWGSNLFDESTTP